METVIKTIHGLKDILVKLQSSKCVYILFSCTQHVSGSIYPILDNPPRLATNVNSIWLSYFSSLLKKINSLKWNDTYINQKEGFDDSCIMQDILQR